MRISTVKIIQDAINPDCSLEKIGSFGISAYVYYTGFWPFKKVYGFLHCKSSTFFTDQRGIANSVELNLHLAGKITYEVIFCSTDEFNIRLKNIIYMNGF